jgi:hypothetical protein
MKRRWDKMKQKEFGFKYKKMQLHLTEVSYDYIYSKCMYKIYQEKKVVIRKIKYSPLHAVLESVTRCNQ